MREGVGGPEEDGEGASTSHILGPGVSFACGKEVERNLPVRFCSCEFCDCVREGGEGSDVENWVGILSVVQTAVVKNDGEELETGGL